MIWATTNSRDHLLECCQPKLILEGTFYQNLCVQSLSETHTHHPEDRRDPASPALASHVFLVLPQVKARAYSSAMSSQLCDACRGTGLPFAHAMGVNRKAIRAMFPKEKWKILRGDKVIITAGKDKGQTGIVTKVIRDERIPKVIVEGRNLVELYTSPGLPFSSSMFLVLAPCGGRYDTIVVYAEQESNQADSRQPWRPHLNGGIPLLTAR